MILIDNTYHRLSYNNIHLFTTIYYPNQKNIDTFPNQSNYSQNTAMYLLKGIIIEDDKGFSYRQCYLNKYNIIDGMMNKIEQIENNQKPKINTTKIIIYVFRALNTDLTLYKIGKTIYI